METGKIISIIQNALEEVKQQTGLAAELRPETELINEVGLDSLEMVDFMLKLEEGLDIALDFQSFEFKYLETIQTLANFISSAHPGAAPEKA